MTIGKAVLGDLCSDMGYIKSVTVIAGELLYRGKTYEPGKYKAGLVGLDLC